MIRVHTAGEATQVEVSVNPGGKSGPFLTVSFGMAGWLALFDPAEITDLAQQLLDGAAALAEAQKEQA